MAISNFQDIVQVSSDTIYGLGQQFVLGSNAGSKSIVFAQDPALASALMLIASNPTAARSIIFPDANGTVGLVTAFAASGGTITNGQVSFANSNGITFGINGSTATASVAANAAISYLSLNQANQTYQCTILSRTVQRFQMPFQLSATRFDVFCASNGNSNATGTMSLALYTMNGSTASAASSMTVTATMASGGAYVSFSLATWNITPGDWMVGILFNANVAFAGILRQPLTNSVPYFNDGVCAQALGSMHVTGITQSVPSASSSQYGFPLIIFAGSGTP